VEGVLPTKSFFIILSAYDRIRVRMTVQQGTSIEIMVQLESVIMDIWRPVRRYDTSHGYLHIHSAPWDDAADQRTRIQHDGLKRALNTALREIRENWPKYREVCEAAIVGGAQ
jgi:hypothetical protein